MSAPVGPPRVRLHSGVYRGTRGVGIAVETAAVVPEAKPAFLGFLGVVLPGQLGRHESPPCRTILSGRRRTTPSRYHNDRRCAAKAREKRTQAPSPPGPLSQGGRGGEKDSGSPSPSLGE